MNTTQAVCLGLSIGAGIVCFTVLVTTAIRSLRDRRRAADHPVMTSRPIDNERPPRFVTIDEETTCSCHGETLQDGSTALYWPLPAELLCERTYEHGEPAT